MYQAEREAAGGPHCEPGAQPGAAGAGQAGRGEHEAGTQVMMMMMMITMMMMIIHRIQYLEEQVAHLESGMKQVQRENTAQFRPHTGVEPKSSKTKS